MAEEEIQGWADPWDFGVFVYDQLSPQSKLAMLAEIARPLLRETKTCPTLTALNEATVAVVYEQIALCLLFEIDNEGVSDEPFYWRRLVLAAWRESEPQEADDRLDETCRDVGDWQDLVQLLSERILWDSDYNMGAEFLDNPPVHTALMKQMMTIDDDYFTAIPPDPSPTDLDRIREELRQVLEPDDAPRSGGQASE